MRAIGMAEKALRLMCERTQQRVAFGKPIAEQQGIQFMLADMGTKLEGARGLLYRVANMLDDGVDPAAASPHDIGCARMGGRARTAQGRFPRICLALCSLRRKRSVWDRAFLSI
jgi:alkylation response protein AidB-like acyl-CoA dehydrogenase